METLIELVAASAVLYGIYLVSLPAALIVGGVMALLIVRGVGNGTTDQGDR